MLNSDPAYLMEEIGLAEKVRQRFLSNTTDLVRRFVGNWYRSDSRTRNRPENMLYAFVATLLPGLVFDNPAVTMTRSIPPHVHISHMDRHGPGAQKHYACFASHYALHAQPRRVMLRGMSHLSRTADREVAGRTHRKLSPLICQIP